MDEVGLERRQIEVLAELSKEHSFLFVKPSGPLLAVRFYVQSASSSGYTVQYYNKKGKLVDA